MCPTRRRWHYTPVRRGDHNFATGSFICAARPHLFGYRGGAGTPAAYSLSLVPRLAPGLWLGRFFVKGRVLHNSDDDLRRILTDTRVIALVGWSPNPERPSHRVAAYLVARGYRVIPVNPGQAGKIALGEVVRASLADIVEPVDMVDIFRRSEEVAAVVDDALRCLPDLKAIWMQLGVEDAVAAAKARLVGLDVVMNRCPAIEIPRLGLL